MQKIGLGLFLCLLIPACFAQDIKALRPGDTLPPITVGNVLHYKSDSLNLGGLRGRPVILDFWGPNCISCLQSFPYMEQLQKELGDSVVILLVNRESKDSTLRFFAQRKKLKIPQLIMVTGDTALGRLFPHTSMPFHAWVDKDGVLRHRADAYNATLEKVLAFVRGEGLQLQNYAGRAQYIRTLFQPEWENQVEYCSYISRVRRGIVLGAGVDTAYAHLVRNYHSALELYLFAFSDQGDFTRPGRLAIYLTDSFRYRRPKDKNLLDSWAEQYCYDYQLLLPKYREGAQFSIMREDLGRYFGLRARIEHRKVPCLTLIQTGGDKRLRSKSNIAQDNFRADDIRDPVTDSIRYFNRQPWEVFATRLGAFAEYYLQLPFVDATGIDPQLLIDFKIEGAVLDRLNRENLRAALRPYGLDLVERVQELEVLVISDP